MLPSFSYAVIYITLDKLRIKLTWKTEEISSNQHANYFMISSGSSENISLTTVQRKKENH